MCCMVLWCVLATAILVASTHAFTPSFTRSRTILPPGGLVCPSSVEGLVLGLRGPVRWKINQHFHMQGDLWARRRSGAPVRLSPAETGVPEVVQERPTAGQLDPTGKEDDGGSPPSRKKLTERSGLLLLATVPLVWGTYGPSVKLMYQMGESPPGLLFNFACYAVSVMTFAAVASFNRAKGHRAAGVCCVALRWSSRVLVSLAALAYFSARTRESLMSRCNPTRPPSREE